MDTMLKAETLPTTYAEMAADVALSVAAEVFTALLEHPDQLVQVDVRVVEA